MSDVLLQVAFVSLFLALPFSQVYALKCWYRLVTLMDSVHMDTRHRIGWPDIHHTQPGIMFAATGWCERKIRHTYWRVLLRGLPQKSAVPSAAVSAARLMRQSMLFALATTFLFALTMMQAYGSIVVVACALIFVRELLGDWKETDGALEAGSK